MSLLFSRRPRGALLARVVGALRVALQLVRIEVHVAQVAGRVAFRLIVEVLRRRVAALAAGADGARLHAVAELHDRDEAVAAGAVHLLRPGIGARTKGGERSPG